MPLTHDHLFQIFDQLNIDYNNVTHPPVFSFDQHEDPVPNVPGAHCKNLFLKNKKGKMYLVVMQGHGKANLKEFEKAIGSGRLSFASNERLMKYLDVEPGSVTPFAVIHDTECEVQVILDQEMMDHEILNYHPLRNDMTTGIKREDLFKFFEHTGHKPVVLDLPKS